MVREGTVRVVLTALVGAVLAAVPAAAAPGDVYLSDQDAGPGLTGAVFRIGPGGGAATLLASDLPLESPTGMAFDRTGNLLIADYAADSILKLDPRTGTLTTFVTGFPLEDPRSVGLTPDGSIYVFDSGSGLPGNPAALFKINPRTKAISTVTSGGSLQDGQPTGLALDRNGHAFLANSSTEILRVDLATGVVTSLTGTATVFTGPGVVLSPNQDALTHVADSNQLRRLNLGTGASTGFATVPGAGLRYLAPLPSGFLVSDASQAMVWKVGASGTPVTSFSADAALTFPDGILVEPRRCGGRRPTVVGTDGPDVIRGSSFADVVSGLGGRDVIRGLKGRDTLCGGKGRDRLVGGPGRDRLLGGPGRDRLLGGPGRDIQRP